MAKITIGEKKQQSGYFELDVKLELTIPEAKQALETAVASAAKGETVTTVTTKVVNRVVGFANNTELETIKTELIKVYNEEQSKLELEKKLDFYGINFDGTKWSA